MEIESYANSETIPRNWKTESYEAPSQIGLQLPWMNLEDTQPTMSCMRWQKSWLRYKYLKQKDTVDATKFLII